MSAPRSILLLCDDSRGHAGNLLEHISAFRRYSRHEVTTFNPVGAGDAARIDLAPYDVVVVHYSVAVLLDSYLPPVLREQIASYEGLKVQFIQDEYRWVDGVTARMRELGIDVLFTCIPEAEAEKLYRPRLPDVQLVTTLAGYVPDASVGRLTRLDERPLDVGYRGRTVPYWLGRFGQEKAEIGRGFLERAGAYALRCDIAWSETDRLYGRRWTEFLTSCRAALGTESGSTIADFDGSVERGVRDYLAAHPTATFDEIERDVLAAYEGNLDLKVISPRQFEAAALQTALVLFPGGYSGILEPDRHYISLERDFSNMDEVAERLRSLPELQAMVDRTHEEIVASGRFSLASFISGFDRLIDKRAPTPSRLLRKGRRLRRPLRARLRRLERPLYLQLRSLAALGFLARRRVLRRLAAAWLRDADARRAIGPARLLDDLLKLMLLLEAQRGQVWFGPQFRVEWRLDPAAGRLVFGSRPFQSDAFGSVDGKGEPEIIGRALREGRVDEIVWNHVGVGEVVWAPLIAGRKVAVHVGYHAVNGAHSFRALTVLARRSPRLVLEVLQPLLGAPAVRLPADARDQVR
jgi:hypothetical protein